MENEGVVGGESGGSVIYVGRASFRMKTVPEETWGPANDDGGVVMQPLVRTVTAPFGIGVGDDADATPVPRLVFDVYASAPVLAPPTGEARLQAEPVRLSRRLVALLAFTGGLAVSATVCRLAAHRPPPAPRAASAIPRPRAAMAIVPVTAPPPAAIVTPPPASAAERPNPTVAAHKRTTRPRRAVTAHDTPAPPRAWVDPFAE